MRGTAARQRRVVGVADGDGQRVRRVVGRRRLAERQQRLDHAADLVLRGAAGPADGALDLLGRVLRAGDRGLPGGEQDRAARLPDREGRARVDAEVEALQRDRVRLVLGQQLGHARVQGGEAQRWGDARAGPDDPAVQRGEPPAAARHHAVARVGQAGIDAEDLHADWILRPAPDASHETRARSRYSKGAADPGQARAARRARRCSCGRRGAALRAGRADHARPVHAPVPARGLPAGRHRRAGPRAARRASGVPGARRHRRLPRAEPSSRPGGRRRRAGRHRAAAAAPDPRDRHPRAHGRRRAGRAHARHRAARGPGRLRAADRRPRGGRPSPRGLRHRLGRRRAARAGRHARRPPDRRRRRPRARPRAGRRRAPRSRSRRVRRTPTRPTPRSSRRWPARCSSATATPASTPIEVVEMARSVAGTLGLDAVEVEHVAMAAQPARHRQGRDARPHPAQARPARRGRVGADARAPGHRRAHPARDPRHGRRRQDRAPRARALRRRPATPTAWPARRSRSAAASSSPATPTAR